MEKEEALRMSIEKWEKIVGEDNTKTTFISAQCGFCRYFGFPSTKSCRNCILSPDLCDMDSIGSLFNEIIERHEKHRPYKRLAQKLLKGIKSRGAKWVKE